MKLFKKVLSVVLAAMLLLTLIPLSVFADDSTSGATVTQGEIGTGADGTVTIAVSASQLSALLRSLDDEDALKDALKAMITREGSLISIDELIDVIPMDNLITLIIGENGEYVSDLIEALGGIDHVLELVDVNALIDSANTTALSDFISNTTGVESTIKTDEMKTFISGLTDTEIKALFGDNYDTFVTAVSNAIKNGTLTDNNGNPLAIDDLVDFATINASDFDDAIEENASKLLSALTDMLDDGITIPEDAYTVNTANIGNDALRTGMVEKIKNNATTAILTDAGVTAAAELVLSQINIEDYISESDLGTLLDENPGVVTELLARLNGTSSYSVSLSADDLLTSEGKTALEERLTAAGRSEVNSDDFTFLRQNNYLVTSALASAVADVVTDLDVDVTSYLDVDAILSGGNVTFTQSDLSSLFGTAANYNAANLLAALLDVVKDNGLTLTDYLTVDASVLLADSAVFTFFKNHVTDYFTTGEILDILGDISNYLKSTIYTYSSLINLAAEYVDKAKVIDKLQEEGEDLLDYIDLDALLDLDSLDYGALFNLFDTSVLASQLQDDYLEIFGALSDTQRTQVLTLLVSTFLEKFEYITLDGYRIAYKQDGRVLSIDAEALIAALWEIIPKLEDLSSDSFDGTLLSFNVQTKFTTQDSTEIEKDINVVVKVSSGVDVVRRVASVLNRYVNIERNGSEISIDVTLPSAVSDLYRELLETGDTDAINELRQKLLEMEGMTGAEMLTAFDAIPLSEIIAAMNDVDINELYTRLYNLGIVQKALDKLQDLAGTTYAPEDLDTLDELLDIMRSNNLPSIEEIVERISDKLNVDLMAALEKVAKAADENTYVQKLLDKVAELPKVGQYVDGISAEDVLNTYKGMDPVKAVAQFVTDRVGKDLVAKLYSDADADTLYQDALDYANNNLSDAFEKFQTLLINLSDPDYEATNRAVALLQALIPSRVLNAFRNHSLVDYYCGNGVWKASANGVSFSVDTIISRALNLIKRVVSVSDNMEDLIRDFLPSGTIEFDVSTQLTFTDVSQVTYFDADGNEICTTFLPKGTDPEVIEVPEIEGKTIKGWSTDPDNGEAITEIPGDCNLYASYVTDFSTVTFRYFNGSSYEDLGVVEVETGKALTDAQIVVPAVPSDLVEGGYQLVYVAGTEIVKDTTQYKSKADLAAAVVTDDITYTAAYLPVGLIEDSEALVYLTTDDSGNWTATLIDASDINVTLDLTHTAVSGANSLTVKSGTVTMAISSELLATIKATGNSNVRLVSNKASNPLDFKSGDLYTATASEVYDFELLVDVDDSDPTSGTALTSFEGGLTITVKTSSITPVTKDDTKQTNVYIVENGEVATADEDQVTDIQVSETDGTVSFKAPHFTTIAIVNEYRLTAQFLYGTTVGTGTLKINGTVLPDEGMMIPEGATVLNLVPSITGANVGYYNITSMTAGTTAIEIGGNMTMPSADTVVTVNCTAIEFGYLWVMPDGTVLDTKEAAVAWLNANPNGAPDGYQYKKDSSNNYVFENEDLDPATLKATVYCTPALTPIEYAIIFRPGYGAADIDSKFTVEDIANGTFVEPELPEIEGYVGTGWAAYDLSAIKAGGSNVVAGVYTEKTYTVTYVDGTTANVTKGTPVNALTGYTATEGKEIDEITIIKADGTTQTISETFDMPTSDVQVVITEKAKTSKITINGVEYEGSVGDVYTFVIRLASDELLAEAPAGARLVSFTTGEDGSRTLLYAVDVGETNPDLTYRVEKVSAKDNTINNGVLNGTDKDGKAVRYATSDDTTFPSAVYSLAVYESEGRVSTGLIWLWVLLIILLVIAIIVLLYFIILRKGWGPNFFTRVIVAIVTFLGTICLGVYALFSGLVFRKKKDKE